MELFSVYGMLDFRYEGKMYSVYRICYFLKTLKHAKKMNEKFQVKCVDKDEYIEYKDINRLSIEYLIYNKCSPLLTGILRNKEIESHVRKAIYEVTNLHIPVQAIGHIGQKELRITVQGNIYL